MKSIYLDHAATTPLRPEAREAMAPYLDDRFGNPSSTHRRGREARAALERAREQLAAALGAARDEIVFTSGGTEADNLAILGRWRAARRADMAAGPVVRSAVEHKAVVGAAKQAADEGAEVCVLAVDEDGRVDTDAVDEVLPARPAVVSVLWGNNEVGTIQPVAEVAERCLAAGVVFHTDAVQAFGRLPVRVDEVPCDLLSVSAHKLGGPQGMGALFVRDGTELVPLARGGGQESGLRPGTQNVAGAVGFAAAAERAVADLARAGDRLAGLRDRLETGLLERVPDVVVNGGGAERLPQTLNVSMRGVDQEAILMSLDLEGISVSSGSACQSGAVEPSHVLSAMGAAPPDSASVRFSLGRETTDEEIERVLECVPGVVERVRALAAA